jgi:hypothetical protein
MPHAITGRRRTRKANILPLTDTECNQVLEGMAAASAAVAPPADQPASDPQSVHSFGDPCTCPACDSIIAGHEIYRDYASHRESIGPTKRTVYADCRCGRTWKIEQGLFAGRWVDRTDVLLLDPASDAATIARIRVEIEKRRGVIQVA